MRVLVTGANGFLGRKVVQRLLDRGSEDIQVRCLVRKGSSLNGLDESKIEVFRGSLNDDSAIEKMLSDIDVLVHLAASMGGSPMGMYIETVVATEKLMNQVDKSDVKRIVFCSSFSVYGASQLSSGSVFDENCPLETKPHNRDAYAWCKYYQEKWMKMHSGDRPMVVIRPGVIYGEDKGLMSNRVGMNLPGLPFFLKIGGRARVPLTHVVNCADALALATLNDSIGSQDINIVDDECPTQSQYLKMYEKSFGKIPKKIPLPYWAFWFASYLFNKLHEVSKGNFPGIFSTYKVESMYRTYTYSNDKAKRLLGWNPDVSLPQGLAEAETFQSPEEK
ncbi:MAG: NAD(P)-dependent oxidoreductase [Pseudomonadales bacterium]|nr:NAD(P)-dependent oxidoreductase [Pseudomonadales bacterium]